MVLVKGTKSLVIWNVCTESVGCTDFNPKNDHRGDGQVFQGPWPLADLGHQENSSPMGTTGFSEPKPWTETVNTELNDFPMTPFSTGSGLEWPEIKWIAKIPWYLPFIPYLENIYDVLWFLCLFKIMSPISAPSLSKSLCLGSCSLFVV